MERRLGGGGPPKISPYYSYTHRPPSIVRSTLKILD
jgi:hypothetical protein